MNVLTLSMNYDVRTYFSLELGLVYFGLLISS